MASTMTFQLSGRRIPAVGHRTACRRHAIGIIIVVKLLFRIERQQIGNIEITVVRQAVLTRQLHLAQRQGLGHGLLRRQGLSLLHHTDARLDRIAIGGSVVAYDEATHLIAGACGMTRSIGLLLLYVERRVLPAHLSVLTFSVGVGHPQLVRQLGGIAHLHLHFDVFHAHDTAVGRHACEHQC